LNQISPQSAKGFTMIQISQFPKEACSGISMALISVQSGNVFKAYGLDCFSKISPNLFEYIIHYSLFKFNTI
jgi:hypothetical protein